MKSISSLLGRAPSLRTMMTVILLFGLASLGWGQIALRGTATSATTNNTTLTINRPAEVVSGDVMLVNITQANNPNTDATGSGWEPVAGARHGVGTNSNRRTTVLYKVAGGTEPTTYSFATATGGAVGSIIAFSGVDASEVFDIAPGSFSVGANTTITATGITTSTNNAAVIFLAGAFANSTSTYSSWTNTNPAFTEIMDFSNSTSVSVGAAWGTLAAAGITGNKSVTVTGNYYWAGILIALKPAPPAPIPGATITQTYSTAGTFSWTAPPSCVTNVTVEAWGGGGAGGGNNSSSGFGGGGGGGGYTKNTNVSVTPGTTYTNGIVVGAGGIPATNAGLGGSSSVTFGSTVTAAGGSGGTFSTTADQTGGTAGQGGNGGVGGTYTGGRGSNSTVGTGSAAYYGGGGGGSAGTAANGNGGTGPQVTGYTAVIGGGPGGNGQANSQYGNGSAPASGPGGGGGGGKSDGTGTAVSGGNGYAGQVIITYTLPSNPSITLGSNPVVCPGTISANLSYSNETGCPDKYSIDWNTAANTAGFIDVTNDALDPSPIVLDVPSGAAAGTYTGTLTVKNNVYGFVSQTYPISVTVDANSWVGTTTSTDWNTATNWSCGSIPAPGQDVIFATNPANDLILDQDRTIGNLVNNSTRALVIPTGRTLTIGSTATVNNEDRILIKSNVGEANGALIFSQPNLNTAVKATVEYDSKSYKPSTNIYSYVWQYIGTPVNEATPTSVFGANNVNVSGSKYGSAESVLIRKYDESKNEANDYGDKWIEGTPVDVAMTPFAGYEVVQPSTVKPEKDDLISPYLFKGTLVTENKDVTLTTTPTAPYAGTFTLANPYAAPIFFDKMEDTDFGNLERIIYIYNTGSRNDWIVNSGETQLGELPGTYTSIPLYAASTIGMTQIPSMQGFLVATPSIETGSSTFKFRYATVIRPSGNTDYEPMRVQSADAASDAKGKPVQKIKPLITMDVIGAASSDRLYLITADKTTKAYNDGWDGYKFISPNVAQLYAIDSDGNPLQVNTDSDLNETYIGFRSGGESSYRLRFKFSNMDGVYSNLYLNDLATGTTHALTDGTILNFSTVAGSAEKRFKIFANAAKGNSGNTNSKFLKISTASNLIVLDNSMDESGVLKVYDLLGTTVYEAAFVPGSNNFTLNMKKGSYIIEAKTASEKSVVKSILK